MDENNTPVQLQTEPVYPLAGNWARFWANFTDTVIIGIICGIILIPILLLSKLFKVDILQNSSFLLVLTILFEIVIISYKVYLTVTKGGTIGKDLYGLKVYQVTNNNLVSYKTSIIREVINNPVGLIPLLGTLFVIINLFFILFTKRGIHDRIAKTRVVKVNPVWPMGRQLVSFIALIIASVTVYSAIYFLYPVLLSRDGFSNSGTNTKTGTINPKKRVPLIKKEVAEFLKFDDLGNGYTKVTDLYHNYSYEFPTDLVYSPPFHKPLESEYWGIIFNINGEIQRTNGSYLTPGISVSALKSPKSGYCANPDLNKSFDPDAYSNLTEPANLVALNATKYITKTYKTERIYICQNNTEYTVSFEENPYSADNSLKSKKEDIVLAKNAYNHILNSFKIAN